MGTLYAGIVAKEAYEKYGEQSNVGTGPFRFFSVSASRDEILLVKNQEYYLADANGVRLPYLDTVAFKVYDRKVDELFAFQNGTLSIITGLPASKVSEVVQEDIQEYSAQPPSKILVREPQLSTQYYEFNLTKPHFKDVRVRQAFNYAINRKAIIENVLSNQANGFGEYGITPPISTFDGYNYDAIKEVAYDYNPEKARQLMAQAGFPNGKGFPDLQLLINSGGAENNAVATEVADQLNRTLGVNVNFTSLPFAKKVQEAQHGRGDIFRTAWVADYPSPESFLLNFYGKFVPATLNDPSWPNTSRYKSDKFDALLEEGMRTTNRDERLKLFGQAEVEMMKDAPAMILWYKEDYNMHLSVVRNIKYSPLQVLNLTNVYLKPWTAEEWKKSKEKK
jgi:ABC-type transport system substrate-binding protein